MSTVYNNTFNKKSYKNSNNNINFKGNEYGQLSFKDNFSIKTETPKKLEAIRKSEHQIEFSEENSNLNSNRSIYEEQFNKNTPKNQQKNRQNNSKNSISKHFF
jgi:hypothetical protein